MATREKVLSLLAYGYLLFTKSTLRVRRIKITDHLKSQFIYALWHGDQLVPLILNAHEQIAVMCSMSKDGEIQAGVLNKFGFIAVRGSSSRGGQKALMSSIEYAKKGHIVAFTVDGPKGPIYKVKTGLLLLAQTLNLPLCALCGMTNRYISFNKSWEKYKLPLPFSRAIMIYGAPTHIAKDDNLEEKALVIEKNLNELTEFASKYAWSKNPEEYLKFHPRPKILIKCKDNFDTAIKKVEELKKLYSKSLIVFTGNTEVCLQAKQSSFIDGVIDDKQFKPLKLRQEFFDVSYGTSFLENILLNPVFSFKL